MSGCSYQIPFFCPCAAIESRFFVRVQVSNPVFHVDRMRKTAEAHAGGGRKQTLLVASSDAPTVGAHGTCSRVWAVPLAGDQILG